MRAATILGGILGGWLAAGVLASTPASAQEASLAYTDPSPPVAETIDAKQVIREKAMTRAKARANRMAAQKWYGYVPARPRTFSTPLVGAGTIGRVSSYYINAPRRPLLYRYR